MYNIQNVFFNLVLCLNILSKCYLSSYVNQHLQYMFCLLNVIVFELLHATTFQFGFFFLLPQMANKLNCDIELKVRSQ